MIDSIKLFGFKDGFDFWFRWSFIDPIETFVWLNITHKPHCTEHGWYCKTFTRKCIAEKLTKKSDIIERWERGFEECKFCNGCGIIDDGINRSLADIRICPECHGEAVWEKGKYAPKNMKNKVK